MTWPPDQDLPLILPTYITKCGRYRKLASLPLIYSFRFSCFTPLLNHCNFFVPRHKLLPLLLRTEVSLSVNTCHSLFLIPKKQVFPKSRKVQTVSNIPRVVRFVIKNEGKIRTWLPFPKPILGFIWHTFFAYIFLYMAFSQLTASVIFTNLSPLV